MEGCPKTLMITFDLKDPSPLENGFDMPLSQYIQHFYHEDPAAYKNEIQQISNLRKGLNTIPRDVQGCRTLRRYYTQLHYLQSRFPMEGGEASVPFIWYDVYNGDPVVYNDIRYEQACVLFNVGGLYSQLAANENRLSDESLKNACTQFQAAAGAFQFLKDNFTLIEFADMTEEILQLKITVLLGQALECILEKSILDNKNAALIARICNKIVEYFNESVDLLAKNGTSEMGSSLRKSWSKHLKIKILSYEAMSHLYMGNDAEQNGKYGEKVTYLKAASDKINEASKMLKNQAEKVIETVNFVMDVVGNQYQDAVKNNDFIYHMAVPDISAMETLKPVNFVKPLPFQFDDKDVAGPDIFQRLVPMKAHEASSLYSEVKANLLRGVSSEVEQYDVNLSQYLSAMKVDDLLDPKEDTLPDDFLDRNKFLRSNPNLIPLLGKMIEELELLSTGLCSVLKNIQHDLGEELVIDGKDQKHVGQLAKELDALVKETKLCSDMHLNAQKTNEKLVQHFVSKKEKVLFLSNDPQTILQTLPSSNVVDGSIDEPIVQRLREILGKVEKMKSQRQTLLSQLRQELNKDDVTADLAVIKDKGEQDAFFKEAIKKHDKTVGILKQNLSAQENILQALIEANAKYATIRQKELQTREKFDAQIQEYLNDIKIFLGIQDKIMNGISFFKELQQQINKLNTKVVDYINERKKKKPVLSAGPSPVPTPSRPTSRKPDIMRSAISPVLDVNPQPHMLSSNNNPLHLQQPSIQHQMLGPQQQHPYVLTNAQPIPILPAGTAVPMQSRFPQNIQPQRQFLSTVPPVNTMYGQMRPLNTAQLPPPQGSPTLPMSSAHRFNMLSMHSQNIPRVSVPQDSRVRLSAGNPRFNQPNMISSLQPTSPQIMNPNIMPRFPQPKPINVQNPNQISSNGTLSQVPFVQRPPISNNSHQIRPNNNQVPRPMIQGPQTPLTQGTYYNGIFMQQPHMQNQHQQNPVRPVIPMQSYPPNQLMNRFEEPRQPPQQQLPPQQRQLQPMVDQYGPGRFVGPQRFSNSVSVNGPVSMNNSLPNPLIPEKAGYMNRPPAISDTQKQLSPVYPRSNAPNYPVTNQSHIQQDQNGRFNQPSSSTYQQPPPLNYQYLNTPQTIQQPLRNMQHQQKHLCAQGNINVNQQQTMQIQQAQNVQPRLPTPFQSTDQPPNMGIPNLAASTDSSKLITPRCNGPAFHKPGQINRPMAQPKHQQEQFASVSPRPSAPPMMGQTLPSSLLQMPISRPVIQPRQQMYNSPLPYSGPTIPLQQPTIPQIPSNSLISGTKPVMSPAHDPVVSNILGKSPQLPANDVNQMNLQQFQLQQAMMLQQQQQMFNTLLQNQQSQWKAEEDSKINNLQSEIAALKGMLQEKKENNSTMNDDTETMKQMQQMFMKMFKIQEHINPLAPPLDANNTITNGDSITKIVSNVQSTHVATVSQTKELSIDGKSTELPTDRSNSLVEQRSSIESFSEEKFPYSNNAIDSLSDISLNSTSEPPSISSQPASLEVIQPRSEESETPPEAINKSGSMENGGNLANFVPMPTNAKNDVPVLLNNVQPSNFDAPSTSFPVLNNSQGENSVSVNNGHESNLNNLPDANLPSIALASSGNVENKPFYEPKLDNKPDDRNVLSNVREGGERTRHDSDCIVPRAPDQDASSMPSTTNDSTPHSARHDSSEQIVPKTPKTDSVELIAPSVSQSNHPSPTLPNTTTDDLKQLTTEKYSNIKIPAIPTEDIILPRDLPIKSVPSTSSKDHLDHGNPNEEEGQIIEPKNETNTLNTIENNVSNDKSNTQKIGTPISSVKSADLSSSCRFSPINSPSMIKKLSQKSLSNRSTPCSSPNLSARSSARSSPILNANGQVVQLDDMDRKISTEVIDHRHLARQLGRMSFYVGEPDEAQWRYYIQELTALAETFKKQCKSLCKPLPNSNNDGFKKMWDDLAKQEQMDVKNCQSTIGESNVTKNRYRDVLPWDHTRVQLKSLPDDYINATHIDGLTPLSPRYIATQGPIPQTFEDFWTMIWEQRTSVIVMLTNEIEGHKLKCHPYWGRGTNTQTEFGNMQLIQNDEFESSAWKIRTFTLINKKEDEMREVKQYQFTSWPDYGTPETPFELLSFMEEVHLHHQANDPSNTCPLVLHCSAGVGRTGSFCCIYSAIREMEGQNGLIDIPGVIRKLRQCRQHMVQRMEQMIFCFQSISCFAQQFINTERQKLENSRLQSSSASSVFEDAFVSPNFSNSKGNLLIPSNSIDNIEFRKTSQTPEFPSVSSPKIDSEESNVIVSTDVPHFEDGEQEDELKEEDSQNPTAPKFKIHSDIFQSHNSKCPQEQEKSEP